MAKRGENKNSCPYSQTIVEPRPPYDELSHEVDGNALSVRVAKNFGKIKTHGAGWPDSSALPLVQAACEDSHGNKCRIGCAKVNIIPNKPPPVKQPDDESFVLRATRKILNSSDEMLNSLEIELRTPRNYKPLTSEQLSGTCPRVCPVNVDKSDENSKKGKKKKTK